jgi:hypothetical protein
VHAAFCLTYFPDDCLSWWCVWPSAGGQLSKAQHPRSPQHSSPSMPAAAAAAAAAGRRCACVAVLPRVTWLQAVW